MEGGLLVFRVHMSTEALTLELVQVRALGIPLTGLLRPKVLGDERDVDGRFQLHDRICGGIQGHASCGCRGLKQQPHHTSDATPTAAAFRTS